MTRELTGRHVLALFVAGFGVIIAVNLTLAFQAVRTFPGLEVKNSYVASQKFDLRRDAQEQLGWTARAELRGGMLRLELADAEGRPADVRGLSVVIGRATHERDDQTLEMRYDRGA